jgi:hypothetical protein
MGALIARDAQEVMAAVMSAKRFPRDQRQAFGNILVACARPSLAENAMYAYNRGGQEVTGPSIRLAEVLAQNWGNLQFGIREVSRENGATLAEAFCWDCETNVRRSMVFTVTHVRETKGGTKPLESERDIYELIANYGARRMRNCILAVIPGDVVDAAVQECEKTVGGLGEKKERVLAMIKAFDTLGVSRDQIEARMGRRIEAMTTPEFVSFKKIYKAIVDGASKAPDWFPALTDPEKLKKETAAADPGDKHQSAPVMAADKKNAILAFEAAAQKVKAAGENVEKILGAKLLDILSSSPDAIQHKTDILEMHLKAMAKG